MLAVNVPVLPVKLKYRGIVVAVVITIAVLVITFAVVVAFYYLHLLAYNWNMAIILQFQVVVSIAFVALDLKLVTCQEHQDSHFVVVGLKLAS